MKLINIDDIEWEDQIFYKTNGELVQQTVVTKDKLNAIINDVDYINRKELLRILQNGSKYNSDCPKWVIDVINKME